MVIVRLLWYNLIILAMASETSPLLTAKKDQHSSEKQVKLHDMASFVENKDDLTKNGGEESSSVSSSQPESGKHAYSVIDNYM